MSWLTYYSSNEGAAEIDLRGSSWVMTSGSRVSTMPPLPTCSVFTGLIYRGDVMEV